MTSTWSALYPVGLQPSPRYGFFYALDEETDRLVLYSGGQDPVGQDFVNAAQDTWMLMLAENPVRWVRLDEDTHPPIGRRNGAWALDPVGHRFFVWGGTPDARTTSEGLFALDLDSGHEVWTQVQTSNEPPNRSSSSGVYDPARHRILFGFGNTSGAIFHDLVALKPLATRVARDLASTARPRSLRISAEIRDTELELSPLGRILVRNVAMVFDAYLGGGAEEKFSKTV